MTLKIPENSKMTEIDNDSVFESEDDSYRNSEIPIRKQKSCIDAVVDEGWDEHFYFAIRVELTRVLGHAASFNHDINMMHIFSSL